uniref:Uncharacterized protein n=1 Tax=Lotus japonicus TaxID=34305 RepID=I3SK38_LOTJA|nr:unknown [Lotus japonicus]
MEDFNINSTQPLLTTIPIQHESNDQNQILQWGLVGAAVVLNGTWWFIVVAQLVYIFSGRCGPAWGGFSWGAFQNLWGFFRLSLASAVMLCLETWYFMVLILFAGYLKNAEVSVDAFSICMNILGWTIMVSFGMNVACESVE